MTALSAKTITINIYLTGVLYAIALASKLYLTCAYSESMIFVFVLCFAFIAAIPLLFGINMLSYLIPELFIKCFMILKDKELKTKWLNNLIKRISTIRKRANNGIITIYLFLGRINDDSFANCNDETLAKIYQMIDVVAPSILSRKDILIFKKHIEAFYNKKYTSTPLINTDNIQLGNLSSIGWGIFEISGQSRQNVAEFICKTFKRSDKNYSTMSKKLRDNEFNGTIKTSDIEDFMKAHKSSLKF